MTGTASERVLPRVVDVPTSSEWRVWWRTPRPARAYTAALIVGAVAWTVFATLRAPLELSDLAVLGGLLVAGMANVELGRLAEGGRFDGQRIHKGLSAWPFAAALLLPAGLAGWVAASVYLHAWLRGIRITRWKWMGSCAIVVLAATAASEALRSVLGGTLPAAGSARVFGGVILALAAFLATESVLLGIISRVNSSEDERYLRAQLASVSFYTIEASVLASGVLAALLLRYSPGFLVLALPAYALMQRGMLHQPLKYEAQHDLKTGVLNWDAWRSSAAASLSQAQRDGRPAAVLIIDIDGFKAVNDEHGHLAGDEVLTGAAGAVAGCLRASDLIGRFGGDEFCALLPSATFADALEVAERMRSAVAAVALGPALQVTASVGVAVTDHHEAGADLATLVASADRALYQAKRAGRDRVASTGPSLTTVGS